MCQADGSVELYERRTLIVQEVLDEHPGHILTATEGVETCLPRTMPLKPTEHYFLHTIRSANHGGHGNQTVSVHVPRLGTLPVGDPWSIVGAMDATRSTGGVSCDRHHHDGRKKQSVSTAISTASSSKIKNETLSQKIIRHRSFEDEDSERDKQASRLKNGAFTRQRSAECAVIREAIPIDLLIYKSHRKLSTTGRSSYWDASPLASSIKHEQRNYEKAPVDSSTDCDSEFDWEQEGRFGDTSRRRSLILERVDHEGQEAVLRKPHDLLQASLTGNKNSKSHAASFKHCFGDTSHATDSAASIHVAMQPSAAKSRASNAPTDSVTDRHPVKATGSQAAALPVTEHNLKATRRVASPALQVSRAVLEVRDAGLSDAVNHRSDGSANLCLF